MPFLIQLLISVALEIVAFLLMPHGPPPQIAKEQTPTSDASKPIPWVFGEIVIDATNVLWCGDVSQDTHLYGGKK
jgi:hypothetical protein